MYQRNFTIPNNFCFNNCLKKSNSGDVRAQVLQEVVGASHADQGRKSCVSRTFLDPGGQAGSNGTPYATCCLAFQDSPGGGRCCIIYIDYYWVTLIICQLLHFASHFDVGIKIKKNLHIQHITTIFFMSHWLPALK